MNYKKTPDTFNSIEFSDYSATILSKLSLRSTLSFTAPFRPLHSNF